MRGMLVIENQIAEPPVPKPASHISIIELLPRACASLNETSKRVRSEPARMLPSVS